eukprot:761413-Hanusia_phi.AAC.5
MRKRRGGRREGGGRGRRVGRLWREKEAEKKNRTAETGVKVWREKEGGEGRDRQSAVMRRHKIPTMQIA